MAQYLHFYGFDQAPFCPGTNSEELYWNPSRNRLCSTLARAITERKGLIMLTGEEGVGKTTLLYAALESTPTQTLKIISVPAASYSFLEILRTLSWELWISAQTKIAGPPLAATHDPRGLTLFRRRREISATLRYLTKLLREEEARGMSVVLVIDDAHSYPVRSLRQLQRLTRLQTDGRPLVQIVLVGQPELEWKMNLFPLWRLQRQLALRVVLPPLTLNESLAYLRHRLAAATEEQCPAFAPDTLTLLAGLGDGNPYRLNVLGHNALIRGYETQQASILPESITHALQQVGDDLKKRVQVSHPLLPVLRLTGVGMMAGGIAVLSLAGLLSLWQRQSPTLVASVDVEPAFANTLAEVANQELTMSDESRKQSQIMINEEEKPLREEEKPQPQALVATSPAIVRQQPPPAMVKAVPSVSSLTAKPHTSSRSPDQLRSQEMQNKSVAITRKPIEPLRRPSARTLAAALPKSHTSPAKTPTQKPQETSPVKGEKTTRVAKAKVTTQPQPSAVVKRSSPAQKKLPQPRVVQQSPKKTLTQSTNYDRLFDE
jgi:type II secretory pathway predicted ATPase ExeA